MPGLFCTADKIGLVSGGGIVTKHELDALKLAAGVVQSIGQEELGVSNDPFEIDARASDIISRYAPSGNKEFTLAHFYAGCFTQTIRKLRQLYPSIKITYTAAAHDPRLSREEHESLGIPYNYPHMTEPRLFDQYLGGYREADLVICPSNLSAQLMHLFGCKHVTVIPHGVTVPLEPPATPKTFTVGYLGQVGPDKGIKYLLEAWKKLGYKDARLVIAGRGSEHALPFIRKFGGGHIQMLGFVRRLSDFYGMCSVYVQPSVTEGFGIEVLEAMAHARPVIVSQGAGAADVIDPGIDGYLVPIRDVNAIANSISFVRKNAALMELVGAEAAKKAKMYEWGNIEDRYIRTWKQLLGRQS